MLELGLQHIFFNTQPTVFSFEPTPVEWEAHDFGQGKKRLKQKYRDDKVQSTRRE